MIVIGHRGACGYEPENTLSSFKKALEIDVDMIEFDVRKSVDGHLVIMHDATVDRTTNGSGAVVDMSFDQLRKLDAGNGQTVPTLQEVLDYVDKKTRVDIEIKAAEAVSELAYIIREYIEKKGWSTEAFLVSSFDISALHEFHVLAPDIQLMALFSKIPQNWLKIMRELPAQMMAISSRSISKELIEQAHAHGIQVIVYTINEPEEIEQMVNLGVDGICSDYPDRVKASLIKVAHRTL